MGSLRDDLQLGVGGAIWGPVARSVLQQRLTEAALGLRPSIRFRPTRRKPPIPPRIEAPPEPLEKPSADQDNALSDGLEGLELTTREKMILHSMHIRTLHELLLTSDVSLSKYLTKTVISNLKDQPRLLESRKSVEISAETDLSKVSFSKHIVTVLRRMGIKQISDFKRFSKNDLWSQTQLRSVDVQSILTFCRVRGIELKDL